MVKTWVAAAAGVAGIASGALLGPAVMGTTAQVERESPASTMLADRIAVEDLVTRYYAHLGTNEAGAFGDYHTEDAVFDVNGVVSTGREEIEALYAGMGEDGTTPATQGTFHMIISNPVIDIKGDTATARFLWTGVMNSDVKARPQIYEQGREYDLLVKREGEWLISKRTVIADSGIPAMFEATYQPREDYDITAGN